MELHFQRSEHPGGNKRQKSESISSAVTKKLRSCRKLSTVTIGNPILFKVNEHKKQLRFAIATYATPESSAKAKEEIKTDARLLFLQTFVESILFDRASESNGHDCRKRSCPHS